MSNTFFFLRAFIAERTVCPFLATLALSQMTNLDSSKLKGFANNNYKFYAKRKNVYKRVENTVGKGEIARHDSLPHNPDF